MALDNFQRELSRDLAPRVTAVVREALAVFDKVATGESSRSVSTRVRFNSSGEYRLQIRGREGLRYILDGRRPQPDGAPLPPIDQIVRWQAARGVRGNPYAIARSINARGIPGIRDEFTEYVLRRIRDEINDLARDSRVINAFRQDVRELIISRFRGLESTTITR